MSGVQTASLYPPDHPQVATLVEQVHAAVRRLDEIERFTVGVAPDTLLLDELLRELWLSALMHDIGEVRTPLEILNKNGQLGDDEFDIMKRHVIDGTEILRQTPEMPILAPSIAFEHHLRLNSTGHPAVKRPMLNLGTKLCSITNVHDAMRSQHPYQQACFRRTGFWRCSNETRVASSTRIWSGASSS